VQIIKNPDLRERLGMRAKETVRQNFLMSRLVEDWIDLLSNFGVDTEAAAASELAHNPSIL
jgi:trehalose synthase